MSHANAARTPRQRLRVARLIVDDGWPVSQAAKTFNCSWPTANRWAERYAAMSEAGTQDRPSRPHRIPNRNRSATSGKRRNAYRRALIGTAFVHTVIDHHSRIPIPRSTTMKQRSLRWAFFVGRCPSSLLEASSLNGCSQTMAPPTNRTSGGIPALSSASRSRRPGHTVRRRTGRSNASTTPSPTGGRSAGLHNRISPPKRSPGLAPPIQSPQTARPSEVIHRSAS